MNILSYVYSLKKLNLLTMAVIIVAVYVASVPIMEAFVFYNPGPRPLSKEALL